MFDCIVNAPVSVWVFFSFLILCIIAVCAYVIRYFSKQGPAITFSGGESCRDSLEFDGDKVTIVVHLFKCIARDNSLVLIGYNNENDLYTDANQAFRHEVSCLDGWRLHCVRKASADSYVSFTFCRGMLCTFINVSISEDELSYKMTGGQNEGVVQELFTLPDPASS